MEQWLVHLCAIDQNSFVAKTSADYLRTQRRYESLSISLLPSTDPWPARAPIVRIFLVHHFMANNQSAKSLPAYLSHLKSGQLSRGYEWFDAPQLFSIKRTVTALQRMQSDVAKQVRRKTPITLQRLRAIEVYASHRPTSSDLEFFTLCRTLHNGLLRAGEGVQLRVRDLAWSSDGRHVRVAIHASKMNKTGPAEYIELSDWGVESAVSYLRRYLRTPSMHPLPPDAFLFPQFHVKAVFVSRLKFLCTSCRIPGDYAGHSFRSGGASDLWAANVPLEAIQKAGRWKSDAIKLYLRDTSVTVHKIAKASQLCSEHGFDFWGLS